MTSVGLIGDTHGSANVVLAALKRFFVQDIDTIVQVGDFGFWPGKHGATFLTYVNTLLAKNGQTLYVIPGNHEDYNQIKNFPVREDGWQVAKENILVAPRGHRWEWDGISFVALGGAPSVDRAWRVRSMRQSGFPVWWAEEDITLEDMEKTIAGGNADVMIAHDAPLGVPQVESHIFGNPMGFELVDLGYAEEGRQKMLTVVEAVLPKLYFHGHYHKKIDDKLIFDGAEVKIKGLAADGEIYSSGVLDLETLNFKFWYGAN